MKHNISIYDTGRINSYTRRNEGWLFGSFLGGGIIFLIGALMFISSFLDPTLSSSVTVAGMFIASPPVLNLLMFATHRNVGLAHPVDVKVQDAIYSLPKADRKKYGVSRDEINALTQNEADELIREIARYRRARTTNSGINRLLGDIKEYNKVVREIEGN